MNKPKEFWIIETNKPVESMRHAVISEHQANLFKDHWGSPHPIVHVVAGGLPKETLDAWEIDRLHAGQQIIIDELNEKIRVLNRVNDDDAITIKCLDELVANLKHANGNYRIELGGKNQDIKALEIEVTNLKIKIMELEAELKGDAIDWKNL